MNLNLTIIRDYLPSAYRTQLYGPIQKKLVCPRPLLYTPYSALSEQTLCVMPDAFLENLSPNPDCSIIVVGNQLPVSWADSGASILQIQEPRDFYQVFNTVSQIFNDFDQWEASLRNELEKQTDFNIKEILSIGVRLLQNDISVTDHTLQVILRAEIEKNQDGSTRISIIDEPHSIDLKYTDRIKNVCHLERNITVPYISSMENSSIRSYCYNLYPLGHFTGCISVTELSHPFRDSDFALADFYFSYFQKAFEKYLQSFHATGQASVSVVQKLLKHIPLSRKEKQSLELLPDETYMCFKLKEKKHAHVMPLDYMHALLCAFFPDLLFSAIHHNQILGLIKLSPAAPVPSPLPLFQDLIEKMNYMAGLSNSFTDLSQISIYFLQADYAISRSGSDTEGAETLLYFEGSILSYMLTECTSHMPVEALTDNSLRRVLEYDRKKHTEYLHTLDVYLKNECSISKTAEGLFIHRSSLLKRLDKLSRLLQKDLSDPGIRLYYRIWLSLYQEAQK